MHFRTRRACLLSAVALLWASGGISSASAQVRMAVEAISGEPWGVGRITVDVPKDLLPEPLGADGLGLSEKSNRVFFPVFHAPILAALAKDVLEGTPLLTGGPVREDVRGLLRDLLDQPPRTTVYFLFRGSEPLELSLQARSTHAAKATPRANPRAHRLLLDAWWTAYTAPPRLLEKKPDYPPLVENFLKSTLARRMNLRLPKREQTESPRELLKKELGLLMGSESIVLAMEQDRVLGLHNLGLPADQPLPEPIDPPALEVPETPESVAVEPIALRVPAECFYVRFGRFSNVLWLQDTMATWGDDIQNLFAARGVNYNMRKHTEDQLAVKMTVLARLLGETVISDAAIIGTDTFFREGAAFGLLIQARSSTVLSASLSALRLERIAAGGVKDEKVKIGDRDVSYLSSPDGSVRSYYAADGDYHFVSTSKTLVARFLETGSGKGALGASKEFRYARSVMPVDRKDTIWVYLSDAFFRNLTSPRYRIETVRRLQAQVDIEICRLAALAAAAEGKPAGTIEQLVNGGLLPPDFGPRPDGSRVVYKEDKRGICDSLRGSRGALVPAPDVPVTKATQAEVADYRKFADFYRENWGRMDPTIIGLKRHALAGNREQIAIDLRMTPFAPKHFEVLSQWAGAPDKRQIAAVPGDIARLEFVRPDQHLFAGVRDVGLPVELADGRFLLTGRLRDILVGYVGTTGEIGLLGFLDSPIVLPAVPGGAAGVQLGALRRKTDEFTVFSLQPEVLETVVPQLRFEESPRPAQLRLWLGDVSQARITPFLNNWGYSRTRATSLSNLRLMHALDQQLHVPPKDAKDAAEFVLSGKLICPLGGEYVYRESRGEVGRWTSTGLGGGKRLPLVGPVPEGYQAPPLNWLRGLDLDATMTQKQLSAHADAVMQLPEKREER